MMARYRKYIAYSETMRNDQIIEAKDINEAKKIAEREFGKGTKVQQYSKKDEEVWG